ncbi:hypothetical protein KP22_10640 [Pectobacterium betavasculorum]|uniref:Uncharacterized protein n=1 Tax=Pectobacterium betavasculorum TaxID=55207 RepID=A0A093VFT9_9GAMM|nr:hypothetical protein KP22_10640 [Pectobacterium betavasculorum]KFX19443.1 hypothetical protein JV35_13565 [Pectobacterium betavasculorum]
MTVLLPIVQLIAVPNTMFPSGFAFLYRAFLKGGANKIRCQLPIEKNKNQIFRSISHCSFRVAYSRFLSY